MKVIFPPRPEGKINPIQLDKWEAKRKYIVQRKFNGHRNLIHRSIDGKISLFSRYGKPHSKYRTPEFLKREIETLNFEAGKEYWLDGELLHPRIPDTVVLYDCLQAGKYFFGLKLLDRLNFLTQICRSPFELAATPIALKVTEHVWLAESWKDRFSFHFKELGETILIEGLVLKELESNLDSFGHKPYNVSWQWRCRRPGASYLN